MAHHYEDDIVRDKQLIKPTKEFNRNFSYKKYTFNIQIKLDAIIERHINGKRIHKIICNDMGQSSNYYKKYEANGFQDLKTTILLAEHDAKLWADKRGEPKSKEEQYLNDNGFE